MEKYKPVCNVVEKVPIGPVAHSKVVYVPTNEIDEKMTTTHTPSTMMISLRGAVVDREEQEIEERPKTRSKGDLPAAISPLSCIACIDSLAASALSCINSMPITRHPGNSLTGMIICVCV